MPHQGPRAPGTQALCTMSQMTPDIFPLERLPAPQEESDGLSPGLISLFILLKSSPPCSFQPKPHSTGPCPHREGGAEGSFLSALPSKSVPEMEFPASSQAGRNAAHPPVSQSGIVGGIGSLPLHPCPASPWSGLGPLDVPPRILYHPCVCVCVCAPVPFKKQECIRQLREGVVCRGGPSVWCYPGLLCPAMMVRGAFPTPTAPCSAPFAALRAQARE